MIRFWIAVMARWTTELKEFVRQLWSQNKSAADIAEAIAQEKGVLFSRNAIMGLEWRNGWSHHTPLISKPPKPEKQFPTRKITPHMQPPMVPIAGNVMATAKDDAAIPVEQRLSVFELKESTCHWPVGDPQQSDFFFCGGPALEGSPYCRSHYARAYQRHHGH